MGIAAGAIIAGAMAPRFGWVSRFFLLFLHIANSMGIAVAILYTISDEFCPHPDSIPSNPTNRPGQRVQIRVFQEETRTN